MRIRQNIPNTLTCANLACGCVALVLIFNGDLIMAAGFVALALLFDFFDGFVARMLGVTSGIGKDLDSLADMVTFGVVPGAVMFQILNLGFVRNSVGSVSSFGDLWLGYHEPALLSYTGFVITVFSCIRLAVFNNDTRQSESFIGLPTPANTAFIVSLPLILYYYPDFLWILNIPVLLILTGIMSYLLVAPLPLFSLKFKFFTWKGNQLRYLFLLLSLVMAITLAYLAVPLIILLYVALSVVDNIFLKKEV